ncbi:MAG: ABC transporter substrate-binding protein [Deltaproteobacteria bacterium]|nr:ABC transporter substrate-binding protein [Deltaproteobacteria bacterium]
MGPEKPSTPTLYHSRRGWRVMAKSKDSIGKIIIAFALLVASAGRGLGQEVFIGNPGKSLNFFHFDLAIERGFFKELGLDVKLLTTKCDVAVTALLTGDLQATGCVGTASRAIASQNVPVRTVIWLFKKPTFYVVAKPEIKSAADLKGKIIGISSFGSDTDLAMKVFALSGKLDPEKDIKRVVAGSTATRLQGLKAGSMDATTLSPPFNVYAEQMGLRVLAYTGDYLEFPQSGFTVSDATLKNKRDLIKRLLRGTLRGLQFTLKNRVDTVRFIAKDYKLQDAVAERVYTSLLPAMSENGLATEKGLRVMVETLGTAVGKNVDFPPERLVDYNLLREVQKELGM